MARTLTLPALLVMATSLTAQYAPPDPSGFQRIIVENYYVSDANDAADEDGGPGLEEGAVTYRVFVDLKPGYKLLTVGGFANHPITFSTTTRFFNNEDRGQAWGDDIDNRRLNLNTVAIDSWLTIGGASNAHWGVPKAHDPDGSIVGGPNNNGGSNGVPGGLLVNAAPAMGVPLTTSDGLWSAGTPPSVSSVGTPPAMFDAGTDNTYSNSNFAWAVLGGVLAPDTANRILIGQFTTAGTFEFCLNLWVRIPDSLVCNDPNCHEIMEFYGTLLPSDTAGTGFNTHNKFTHPTLCFNSSQFADCQGTHMGPAQPGTACDDGNPGTPNDTYTIDCACMGADCLGVLGGSDLPGTPCDDGDPDTENDTWQSNCVCNGIITGIDGPTARDGRISVHPNPTRDLLWLWIAGAQGERAGVELRDALGRRVIARDLGTLTGDWKDSIDLSGLERGTYLMVISVGDHVTVERIIRS